MPSRVHRQGIPLKNISAVDKCREEGWTKDMYLVAPNWSTPRQIKEVRETDVMLDSYSKNRVKSFHPEVRLATSQEAAAWQVERKRLLKQRDRQARKKPKIFVVRVIEQSTGKCVHEVPCGTLERKAEKVELGMLRNMDLDRFCTEIVKKEAS